MGDENKTTTRLNRRKLFSMIAADPALRMLPVEPDTPQTQEQASVASELSGELRGYMEQIHALESQLASNNGTFSWAIHNELRHYYLAFDQEKSLEHSDIILSHHLMDDYILNTLSDWHFVYDRPQEGIVVLLNLVETYGKFEHVAAASLIKIGDVSQKHNIGDFSSHYSKVIELTEKRSEVLSSLKQYNHLAKLRLGKA